MNSVSPIHPPVAELASRIGGRILIAAGNLGFWGETDGVVTTYRNLIPRFVKHEVEADIIAYGPDDRIEKQGRVNLISHKPRVPLRIDPTRWIDPAFPLTSSARRLRDTSYRLIQSSTPDPLGLFALGRARQERKPIIMIYHTALDHYAEIRYSRLVAKPVGRAMGKMMSAYLKWYYDKCSLILAPSRYMVDELSPHYSPEVAVLSRGVDTTRYAPSFRTRKDARVRAVYVGRVAPEKNLALIVELFRTRTDIDLVVAGDGPYLNEMKAELPRATFVGKVTGEELARTYADGDIYLFPSRTDTLGNSVLEAMSSGLPVIVTDSMGPQELVEQGVTGFVARSREEFDAALTRLASDTELRKQMGTAARHSASQRSWDEIFGQLLAFYVHVLETPAAPQRDTSPVMVTP